MTRSKKQRLDDARDASSKSEVCLACEITELNPVEARNSYSRFCDAYICSGCGVCEAVNGFFWHERARAAGVTFNPDAAEYADDFDRSKRLCVHRDDGKGICVDCGEVIDPLDRDFTNGDQQT